MPLDPWSYAKTSEHSHQVALFMWSNMAERYGLMAANCTDSYYTKGWAQTFLDKNNDKIPQLKWLHAIHNQGHGDAIRGAKAKAEGVKSGVSDLFLPVPMINTLDLGYYAGNGFSLHCGLYIELKPPTTGSLSSEQSEFIGDMLAAGYQAKLGHGWLEARKIILDYLQISC